MRFQTAFIASTSASVILGCMPGNGQQRDGRQGLDGYVAAHQADTFDDVGGAVVDLSGDGRVAIVSSQQRGLARVDANTKQRLGPWQRLGERTHLFAVDKPGLRVAAASYDNVFVNNSNDGFIRLEMPSELGTVRRVSLSPDGDFAAAIVSTAESATAVVWSTEANSILRRYSTRSMRSCQLSNTTLYIGLARGGVAVDLESGTTNTYDYGSAFTELDTAGGVLAAAAGGHKVVLYDIKTDQLLQEVLVGSGFGSLWPQLSSDGRLLYVGARGDEGLPITLLTVWRVRDGSCLSRFRVGEVGEIRALKMRIRREAPSIQVMFLGGGPSVVWGCPSE